MIRILMLAGLAGLFLSSTATAQETQDWFLETTLTFRAGNGGGLGMSTLPVKDKATCEMMAREKLELHSHGYAVTFGSALCINTRTGEIIPYQRHY